MIHSGKSLTSYMHWCSTLRPTAQPTHTHDLKA